LEFGRPTGISLLGAFDLSLPDWVLPGPGHIALLIARDTVEGCAVVLLTVVLGAVAGYAVEATPSYASIVLSSIVILIAPKALYNIVAAIKQLTVVELAV
jgi:hypothetical protein